MSHVDIRRGDGYVTVDPGWPGPTVTVYSGKIFPTPQIHINHTYAAAWVPIDSVEHGRAVIAALTEVVDAMGQEGAA